MNHGLARGALAAVLVSSAVAAAPAVAAAASPLENYAAPVRSGQAGPDARDSFNATLPNGRRVTPAGASTLVGELPLGSALTPDGHFLVVSNDDERGTGASIANYSTANGASNPKVLGGYRIAVVDVSSTTPTVVDSSAAPVNPSPHQGPSVPGLSQSDNTKAFWKGVAVKANGDGTDTVYAAGGPSDQVVVYALSATGTLTQQAQISITPPDDPSRPNQGMAAPGGLTLSPDGRRLYVVNNNANTVVMVDTTTNTVVPGSEQPVGFFPYEAVVDPQSNHLIVSNWGVADRVFGSQYQNYAPQQGSPCIGGSSDCSLASPAHLFANPLTDPEQSSSLTTLDLASGSKVASTALGATIDGINVVGGTHPSAMALRPAVGGSGEVLYVADTNEDQIAMVDPASGQLLGKFALPGPVPGNAVGIQPDALALSPDANTLYVAEADLNAVAVLDLRNPLAPTVKGSIPTGWYPSSLQVTPDGRTLLVTDAKGFGSALPSPTSTGGNSAFPDVNYLFGTVQRIDLTQTDPALGAAQVQANTVRMTDGSATDGLHAAEAGVKHVIFVLRENKTYDSYLGADSVLNARGANGDPSKATWDAYAANTKLLNETFATSDNAYADSEESDAGHSFALAGTSTDYQQKTLLSRFSRPFINIKNEDPEDYPLRGYLFNAAARAGISYRDYGDMLRVSGYDDARNPDGCADDPAQASCPGSYSYSDTTSPTKGLGGLFAETTPALKALGGHTDPNYPGWNLRITDQRREREFEADYGRLLAAGQAPQFTFVWLPQDHTGSVGGTAIPPSFEVQDNDVALGRLVRFISHSSVWPSTAIFVTEDDAQSNLDHVYAHRTVTTLISPWARRGAVVHSLSSTASVTKTVDELLGLDASSTGDLLANDLRDWFTATPDLTPYDPPATGLSRDVPAAARRIVALERCVNASGVDQDSTRLGRLDRLFLRSLALSRGLRHLSAAARERAQARLLSLARRTVGVPAGDRCASSARHRGHAGVRARGRATHALDAASGGRQR